MKRLAYPEGATRLDRDEVDGLRLTHIISREELNQFEAENIHAGLMWAKRSRQKDIISESFMRKLHKRMFADVWTWAGEFRKSNKNIGVARERIGIELHKLCEDVKCWIEFESYPADEIAARFHYRLVWIHNCGAKGHSSYLNSLSMYDSSSRGLLLQSSLAIIS